MKNKRKFLSLVMVAVLTLLMLAGCGGGNEVEKALKHEREVIKESPDKYTWYVRDYVGLNVASIGEWENGECYDVYGKGKLKLVYIATDGSYVSSRTGMEYVVVSQNIAPNTEIKYDYNKYNDDGSIYGTRSTVQNQNIKEIELRVVKLPSAEEKQEGEVFAQESNNHEAVTIKASPDKYTWYVKDYVGRNLANIGYTSMGGDRRDRYGDGTIELVLITNDGSYIDIDDEENMKNYVVTGQSVEPNTEIKYTYEKYSDGTECSSLIDTQNIEEIELYVKKV